MRIRKREASTCKLAVKARDLDTTDARAPMEIPLYNRVQTGFYVQTQTVNFTVIINPFFIILVARHFKEC